MKVLGGPSFWVDANGEFARKYFIAACGSAQRAAFVVFLIFFSDMGDSRKIDFKMQQLIMFRLKFLLVFPIFTHVFEYIRSFASNNNCALQKPNIFSCCSVRSAVYSKT